MPTAKDGDTVVVRYAGRLRSGDVFTSSSGKPPLTFTIGKGDVLPGFERAVVGMQPGERRTADVKAEEAFGPHRRELVLELSREQLPGELEPRAGERVTYRDHDAELRLAIVKQVDERTVVIDANHPLAGEDLIFDIELVALG